MTDIIIRPIVALPGGRSMAVVQRGDLYILELYMRDGCIEHRSKRPRPDVHYGQRVYRRAIEAMADYERVLLSVETGVDCVHRDCGDPDCTDCHRDRGLSKPNRGPERPQSGEGT